MLPELVLEKAKIIRAVMTVSWKAITNLCEGKRLKHASLLLPSAFCNLKWIDCDWFEKLLFSTNSLTKLLTDSLHRTVQ